ncbi:ALG6, ALG8 glycosyltransferase family-domain-containing protein [Massariosphaeria phaeospora]|uniref:ALG6, ALG8 glycosyltransferase family-domain-containing protein n=1 Tax=Massariosphaeria phaeospora TaxID=100035 RepID=A0A7C8IAZ8_9PLEO|nr:ALG6, ALG8 glycosyltransferase family-domain-containing protein [Massariosphaeria phaeospora]
MADLYPSIAQCAVVATALKVLLFPAYKSTDFEVHRNWLALTHSLPIKEWYYENTSEWTLDYPPFFAYFEWLLSQVAAYVDPELLHVKALGYDSWQTIYFQRATVILTELVLVYALHLYVKGSKSKTTAHAVALSVLLSPGLLIIDHIHFQYNGFLYGMLVLSLVLARNNSTLLLSGVLFAVLLCFKHIYLYLAPAYFVYLLRAYCLDQRPLFPYFRIRFLNCVKLGAGIMSVFAAAFGPFAFWGQLEQVFRRLFPFSRGLCHAYWAPNVWAIYSFTDRVLIYLAPYLGLTVDRDAVNSVTRGLVGDTSFAVLPDIAPLTCFLLTLAFQIPFLFKLLLKPTWETFVGAVTLCGYASFLFGWHVHEKAILLVIIPFSLISLRDRRYFGAFRPLAVAGHVSLFPLLFTAAEFPVKTVYTIFWLVLFLLTFDRLAPAAPRPRIFLLDRFSLVYIALSIPLIAYCSLVHGIVFGRKYEFLPLMFTSSYSAIGVVQYKRKPVKLEPLPSFLDDSTEIWVIEATGEIFVDYERYLNRRDFYLQNIFTCESTGHQGYNFFEAIESETEASNEINSIFPDTLRSRVLEFIQFRNTARMDDLVNNVFDHFREHYTVGDRVYIEHENGRKYGVISQMQDTSGLHSVFTGEAAEDHEIRSFTYYITLDEGGEPVTRYKASELQRDRRIYSKLVLKQFLRSAVTREPWNGAPWMVKDHLAKRYSIPTRIPEAKTRDAVMAAKKASIVNIESEELPANPPGMPSGPNGAAPLPANGVAVHGPPHMGPPPAQTGPGWMNFAANGQPYHHNPGRPMMQPPRNEPPRPYPVPYPHQMSAPPPFPPGPYNHPPPTVPLPQQLAHMPHHMPPPGAGLPVNLPFQNNFMQYQALAPINALQHQVPTLTRPFEPIKYPIDDLRIKQPRLSTHRPSLKFFSDDVPEGVEVPEDQKKMGILMKSVGPLLCAWETLNVHDTIYSLDSFTFDDFVGAMRFSQEGVECELLIEVHCSVLKQIINESGKFQVTLPSPADSDGSGDEASDKSTSPKPEPEPPVRTTRSSLRKSEASIIVKQRTPTPEPPKQIHKGGEFTVDFNWIDQCKTRNFRDGGWQAIIVGLLYRLSCDPGQKEACDEILAQLVPADEEPSIENIAFNYISLDVNLRISALDMILRLTIATETFRDQLVAASQEMTRLRKEKIEFQKKRKELADELFKLDIDRKIQLPMNTPASPTDAKENQDVLMGGVEDGRKATEAASESSEEPTAANRKLRHTNKAKRKRELDAVKKEKAKKAKVEAAKTKQQKDWEKLLDAIDKKREELKTCEASINELDDDLRETLVHRSKILGKDRFLNKYYWFEHNGMPFGGVPNSSTAEYGYANGRLWVQGPDELELQPNLEEPALSQDKQEFGFTIPMRKEKEEGSTHLATSGEWGYYDDPADVDRLMAWLDERGFREKALRKELQIFRERIVEYMVKMKEHLVEAELEKEEEEEVSTRVATRKKTYVDTDPGQDRCLLWTNSIMRNEFGYNHSEEYEPPKKPKKGTAKVTKAKGKR